MACKVDWEDDENLKQDLAMYVRQGLKRDEIISFLNPDYSCYKWSIRTLDRRLRYFNIYYNDAETPVEAVREAVQKEFNGPASFSGIGRCIKK